MMSLTLVSVGPVSKKIAVPGEEGPLGRRCCRDRARGSRPKEAHSWAKVLWSIIAPRDRSAAPAPAVGGPSLSAANAENPGACLEYARPAPEHNSLGWGRRGPVAAARATVSSPGPDPEPQPGCPAARLPPRREFA